MKQFMIVSDSALRRWFWILLVLNLLFIILTRWYLLPFQPGELINLEVARNTVLAETILNRWQETGIHLSAIYCIYLDYFFIILYVSGLAAGSAFLARLTGNEILIRAGKLSAFLLVAAGICDLIGNILLLHTITGPVTRFGVLLTYQLAVAKFTVVILSILFIVICLVFWLADKLTNRRSRPGGMADSQW